MLNNTEFITELPSYGFKGLLKPGKGGVKMIINRPSRIIDRRLGILLLVWLLLISVSYPAKVLAQKQEDKLIVGMVSAVDGVAEAQVEGEATWEKLAQKDDIYIGDSIRTQTNSKIKLVFKDDSIVSLGPQSLMQVKVFDYTPEREQRVSTFSVAQGKARAVVGRLFGSDSKFEIETPTAVAGVRGTFFMVWVLSPEITRVFVLEGKVTVRNIKPEVRGEVVVTEGRTTTVQEAAPPGAAKKATKEEIQEGTSETQVEGEEESKDKGAGEQKDGLSKVKEIHKNSITGQGGHIDFTGTAAVKEFSSGQTAATRALNITIIPQPPGIRSLPRPTNPPE